MPLRAPRLQKLTAREWCVLRMLAKGITPVLIARKLEISAKTVSSYTNNTQKKLGVANRLFLQKMLIAIKRASGSF